MHGQLDRTPSFTGVDKQQCAYHCILITALTMNSMWSLTNNAESTVVTRLRYAWQHTGHGDSLMKSSWAGTPQQQRTSLVLRGIITKHSTAGWSWTNQRTWPKTLSAWVARCEDWGVVKVTCWPFLVSVASWTKPKVPSLRSLIFLKCAWFSRGFCWKFMSSSVQLFLLLTPDFLPLDLLLDLKISRLQHDCLHMTLSCLSTQESNAKGVRDKFWC